MQKKSYWNETVSIPARNPLAGDISIDTVIIGGGMAGILTAFLLKKKGRECIVLEAERIGGGQTGCTTAKVTSQHNLIYADLIKTKGEVLARQYAQANEAAIREYESVIRQNKIDCDWKECPAYLYADRKKTELHNEYMAALHLGIPARWTEDHRLIFSDGRLIRLSLPVCKYTGILFYENVPEEKLCTCGKRGASVKWGISGR